MSDSISYHARNKTSLATQGLFRIYRTGNTSLVILFQNFCLKLYTIKLRFGFHLLSNSNFLFGGTLLESSVANISNIIGFLVQKIEYINYSIVSCHELLEYSFILSQKCQENKFAFPVWGVIPVGGDIKKSYITI